MTTNPQQPTTPSASRTPSRARRARPGRAPRTRRDDGGPGGLRRRDGVALAATGRVPDRVRAAVLADHHATLGMRSRSAILWRVHAGLHPLTIPYGYRRLGIADPAGSWSPEPEPHDAWSDRRACAGRAKACLWDLDEPAARAITTMATWARDGLSVRVIAARATRDRSIPLPLTASGTWLAWTPRLVRAVLTDPALTGHSVWGRTHHGRPVPPTEWVISQTMTHPPILTVAQWQATRRAVDPTPPGPGAPAATPARDGGAWWAP